MRGPHRGGAHIASFSRPEVLFPETAGPVVVRKLLRKFRPRPQFFIAVKCSGMVARDEARKRPKQRVAALLSKARRRTCRGSTGSVLLRSSHILLVPLPLPADSIPSERHEEQGQAWPSRL